MKCAKIPRPCEMIVIFGYFNSRVNSHVAVTGSQVTPHHKLRLVLVFLPEFFCLVGCLNTAFHVFLKDETVLTCLVQP